eukprot:CAMPEP_0172576356 /NCGR_PEP_ID=MMETSP1067-20121228/137679_1 /TAXON_ID=265564 ORGANISM="Thalassiosira punctigera, Strain Tpunct2005C2" /NCGR_SAMPLE_ID=MMETSP1067 /ASSEMBLY_ACC=CAM_ASM_000444 /LENGTH=310 /DNA_ID=CAMNT_0013369023 /DNA_START=1229 /DNA_END=2163 /DNA_ORIENTATION=-
MVLFDISPPVQNFSGSERTARSSRACLGRTALPTGERHLTCIVFLVAWSRKRLVGQVEGRRQCREGAEKEKWAGAEAEEIETIPEGSIVEDFDPRRVSVAGDASVASQTAAGAAGAVVDDFEPRRVSVAGDASVASRTRSRSSRPAATTAARAKHGGWLSFFSNVGKKSHAFAATGEESVVRGSLSRLPRSAPVKIDPKVFFANERTFLAWMHVSVILAGASVAIVAFSDAAPSRHRSHATVADQLYGVILLPVSIAFILYAMMQYSRRASMIRRKAPGPYVDVAGPTVLTVILMLSIVTQFSVKLYTLM